MSLLIFSLHYFSGKLGADDGDNYLDVQQGGYLDVSPMAEAGSGEKENMDSSNSKTADQYGWTE